MKNLSIKQIMNLKAFRENGGYAKIWKERKKMNKNYFRTGTIVCWDEVGTNQSWDSITDAWDSLKDWAQESGLKKHEFAKRLTESGYLGEEFEPTTVFVYGVDVEATKGYDEARAEAEAEATADEE